MAQAEVGQIALSGVAKALPGAPPFTSPDGLACLWFDHTHRTRHHYNAEDSVRPFLLVDASGSCVVLPAGAEITGSSPSSPKTTPSKIDIAGRQVGNYGERLLCEGDKVHVVGCFIPASAEAIERQRQTADLVVQSERARLVRQGTDPAEFERLRAAATPPLPPPPPAPTPIALPVVCQPKGAAPFVISIASGEGQGGFYRFLAIVDVLVLCASGGIFLWLMRAA